MQETTRNCERCERSFICYRLSQRYCSTRCNRAAAAERRRRSLGMIPLGQPRPTLGYCLLCGTTENMLTGQRCKPCNLHAQRERYAQAVGKPAAKPCDECGKTFVPKVNDPRYRYCSPRCKRQAWLTRNPPPVKEPKPAKPPRPAKCPTSPIWIKTCECSRLFVCRVPNAERCHECRGKRRKLRQKAHGARRRARMTTTTVERFIHLDIFKRDGWRCGICRLPTNRNAVVPHPKAPTLDHIVPLAKGGEHARANVQCAHFECNYLKGDKAVTDGEQLRLVG